MIFRVDRTPECFEHLGPGHRYYAMAIPVEVHDENDEVKYGIGKDTIKGFMAVKIEGVRMILHFEVTEFTHNILRQMKRDFAGFVEVARSSGIQEICAVNAIDPHSDVWRKFIKMFGFPDPYVIATSVMEVDDAAK